MVKSFVAPAFAAALLAGSAVPSFAAVMNSSATYNLGSVNGSATFNLGGPTKTVETGSFVDFYNFNLGTTAQVTLASITNTFATVSQKITNFTVSLFNGSSTALGTPIASNVATTFPSINASAGQQFGGIESDNLGSGNYVVRVSGTTTSSSYGGSLAISAVPLPSTVALFGVALAGLGIAGAVRRKSAASAA